MLLKELCLKIKRELEEEVKILLFETDPFLQDFIKDLLQEYKIKTHLLPALKNLQEVIAKEDFQVFILDLDEPIEKIEEVVRECKEIKKDLLIYFIIDYHKELDIGLLFARGVDEVIYKPFSFGEFTARLYRLLKEYYYAKKIERSVIEDPLTNVYNRRYFEIAIREEIGRALRQKYPLTLLMIDLDKFKWYNDTYGHREGDKVLQSVGLVLCYSTRSKVDKVCRYGGDEFVVILPHTDWRGALKVVERIFNRWDELDFKPVTFSVGISELIDKGDLEKTLSDLIKRADEAMYRAKKREGNTYEVDQETLKLSSGEEVPVGDLSFQVLH